MGSPMFPSPGPNPKPTHASTPASAANHSAATPEVADTGASAGEEQADFSGKLEEALATLREMHDKKTVPCRTTLLLDALSSNAQLRQHLQNDRTQLEEAARSMHSIENDEEDALQKLVLISMELSSGASYKAHGAFTSPLF